MTALIEQRRRELAALVNRRVQKIGEARDASTATVAAIARHVRLSPGRISQIAPSRRGRHVAPGASREANAGVQTAAPEQQPITIARQGGSMTTTNTDIKWAVRYHDVFEEIRPAADEATARATADQFNRTHSGPAWAEPVFNNGDGWKAAR